LKNHENTSKLESEKLASVIKISLLVLILFIKKPNEYLDILTDLYQITKFADDWQKVYTDIFISLLHKGNSNLFYKFELFRYIC